MEQRISDAAHILGSGLAQPLPPGFVDPSDNDAPGRAIMILDRLPPQLGISLAKIWRAWPAAMRPAPRWRNDGALRIVRSCPLGHAGQMPCRERGLYRHREKRVALRAILLSMENGEKPSKLNI